LYAGAESGFNAIALSQSLMAAFGLLSRTKMLESKTEYKKDQ